MEGIAESEEARLTAARLSASAQSQRLSGFVDAPRVDLALGGWPLETRMRRIVHHELGQPAHALRIEEGPSESLGPDQVRLRVSYAPVYPGDLLGVMGSPAFGTPRAPGFEGAGVASEVGARIDPGLGLKPGLRVAFFPASGSWRDEVVVPAGSVVPFPDSIADEIAAQMLINTATALTAIRTAHQPPERRKADIALAQRLAHEPEPLFEVAERYPPFRISNAVAHVNQTGRAGIVLFDSMRD